MWHHFRQYRHHPETRYFFVMCYIRFYYYNILQQPIRINQDLPTSWPVRERRGVSFCPAPWISASPWELCHGPPQSWTSQTHSHGTYQSHPAQLTTQFTNQYIYFINICFVILSFNCIYQIVLIVFFYTPYWCLWHWIFNIYNFFKEVTLQLSITTLQ